MTGRRNSMSDFDAFRDRRDHHDWDALAVSWTLSALDPDDEARVAAHLAGCDRCTETVREALHTVTDLAYGAPDERPPRRLKARIMAAAAAEPRRPAGAELPAPVTPRHRHWSTRLAAAAVVVLLAAVGALVAWNARLRADQHDLRRIVAQREALVQRLTSAGPAQIAIIRRPDGTGDRYATVVVKDGRIGLITETLQPQKDDSTYWLWSLSSANDASPVPLAGFQVPETRFSACNIEPPAGLEAYAFEISVEPGPQRPAKPGRLVGLGETTTG